MIVMGTVDSDKTLKLFGIGVLKIKKDCKGQFDVLFQKGLGRSLIQNIVELYKDEINSNSQGTSFVPIAEYSIFMKFFEIFGEKIVLLYLDEKSTTDKYPQLYQHSKYIQGVINASGVEGLNISECCDTGIEIPKDDGMAGVFILNENGVPLFTRVKNEIETDEPGVGGLIGGFISAILSFSKYLIGPKEDTGSKLKEIDLGDRKFSIITRKGIIFAFLIKKKTELTERYIYLIIDDFLSKYAGILENFNGCVNKFDPFDMIMNQYFNM